MKRRLIMIAVLSLGVATSSYNGERSEDVSDIDVGNSPLQFIQSADSLIFSLDHINTVIDEKRK